MGASGTLLIVNTLVDQNYDVTVAQIAKWSIPIAVISVIAGAIRCLLIDKKIARMSGAERSDK